MNVNNVISGNLRNQLTIRMETTLYKKVDDCIFVESVRLTQPHHESIVEKRTIRRAEHTHTHTQHPKSIDATYSRFNVTVRCDRRCAIIAIYVYHIANTYNL